MRNFKGELVRILSPTENKRFNELVGFVGLSLAFLIALSLLSYSPHDVSFNVSAPPAGAGPARNWIGPVGAHMADLFFQFCGFSAFLIPVGMFLVAMRWFRSQLIDAPVAKLAGATMLLLSLSAELTLIHMPAVRGVLPPGGLLGSVLAQGLSAALNPLGANLVSIVLILTSLFLTTSFSLHAAAHWLKKPMTTDGILGKWMARLAEWREERESSRLRKRVEEIKIAGRPPVAQQRVSAKEPPAAEDLNETDEASEDDRRAPTVIKFHELERVVPPKKSGSEPKISRGKTIYKLPSSSLLQMAERGQ